MKKTIFLLVSVLVQAESISIEPSPTSIAPISAVEVETTTTQVLPSITALPKPSETPVAPTIPLPPVSPPSPKVEAAQPVQVNGPQAEPAVKEAEQAKPAQPDVQSKPAEQPQPQPLQEQVQPQPQVKMQSAEEVSLQTANRPANHIINSMRKNVKAEAPKADGAIGIPVQLQAASVAPSIPNEEVLSPVQAKESDPNQSVPKAPQSGNVHPAQASIQQEQTPSNNGSGFPFIIAGVVGIVILAVGGFVASRRKQSVTSNEVKEMEESMSTKPKDLSLERFSKVPPLAPLRHSTLKTKKTPIEVMEAAERPVSFQIVQPRPMDPRESLDRPSSRTSFDSVLSEKQNLDRDSFTFSEAASGQNAGPSIQQSSIMSMMNSDERGFDMSQNLASAALRMATDDSLKHISVVTDFTDFGPRATAHVSHDSQEDKYDSMVFSDLSSEFAPDF